MGTNLDLTASDGHVLAAYLALPESKPRGGLVVIQEAFGVTAYVRSVCDAYARDGYASIAPAIYDRQRRDAVFDGSPAPEALAEAPIPRSKRAPPVLHDRVEGCAAARHRQRWTSSIRMPLVLFGWMNATSSWCALRYGVGLISWIPLA